MSEDYFFGMSEKDIADYKEAETKIRQEEIEQYNKDQVVLENIKKHVSNGVFEEIKFEMEESEHCSNFRIVEEPIGEQQKNDNFGDSLNVFVDQHSVGDTGDSWAGVVSVELPSGKYLAWDYWM